MPPAGRYTVSFNTVKFINLPLIASQNSPTSRINRVGRYHMNANKGNWLLLIISVLLTLLVAEIALRLSGAADMKVRFQCFDAIIGKVYCDSTAGYFSRATYSNYLVINSDGMVDRQYPVVKPEGTLRIAMLGDSFTAAEYLPVEQKFEGLLEHELSKNLGQPVEILNFGISATETWNQLQVFHLNAAKYQPDVTFLVFFWGNDIRDNIGQLRANSPNPLLDEYDPPLSWRLKQMRKNINKSLWDNSLLYQVTHDGYGNLEQRIESWFRSDYLDQIARVIAADDNGDIMDDTAFGVHNMVDTEYNDDDLFFWDSAGWEITRRLILKLKTEANAAGSRFVILHFPSEGLVLGKTALPHDNFDKFLDANEIPYVSLFRDYESFEYEELRRHFIQGDGHWTPYGHRYVARRTQDMLLDVLSKQ
jgi:hypothetical protein